VQFEQPTVPAPPGGRTTDPVLVEIVIDESPSEYDVDPQSHRHVAARRIVELLRTDLACRGDRVAVVHFAARPGPVLRPQDPHTRRGRHRLSRALRPRGGGSTTDICAALAAAARLLPRRWSGPTVTLVMTDGYDNSSTEELIAAVERFPPRSVHVLSVRAPVPEHWEGVPLGSVTEVLSTTRADAIERAAASLLYRALELT
jgi:Mg-chelatase subunit ChlD